MINQNYAMDLSKVFTAPAPQVSSSQTVDLKSSKTEDKKSVSSFKDMLGSASEKVKDNTGNDKANSMRKDNDTVKDNSFKTFKSANDNRSAKLQDVKDDSKEITYSDAKEQVTALKDQKTDDTKSDEVIQSLAGVLGIDASKLSKLFESLGIKAEDLVDASKADAALEKLSSVLGLEGDQKKTLMEITKFISEQLEVLKSNEDIQKPLTQAESAKPSEVNKQSVKPAVETKPDTTDVKQLLNELKGVIQNLTAKIKDDPKKFYDDLAESVKAVMEKISAASSKDTIPAVSENMPGNGMNNDAGQDADNDKILQQQNTKADETKAKEVKPDTSKETSVKETVAAADNNKEAVNNQPASAVNQPQTELKANTVAKADKAVPVTKSEIVNQVIEKAKVLTNGEKSEMVMDLKPDSLGKLSLKVITERGIVTAQFVAESQQVKQVLESNMQLLKDSLEKQGLAVQNFSVSVGQENSERRFGRNDGYSQENRSTGNKANGLGNRTITTIEEVSSSTQRINPYDWTSSKINLTA